MCEEPVLRPVDVHVVDAVPQAAERQTTLRHPQGKGRERKVPLGVVGATRETGAGGVSRGQTHASLCRMTHSTRGVRWFCWTSKARERVRRCAAHTPAPHFLPILRTPPSAGPTHSTFGGTRARRTTASFCCRCHIGLGRRDPRSGRAFHMYGLVCTPTRDGRTAAKLDAARLARAAWSSLWLSAGKRRHWRLPLDGGCAGRQRGTEWTYVLGLLPNLSVKMDQKVVSLLSWAVLVILCACASLF